MCPTDPSPPCIDTVDRLYLTLCQHPYYYGGEIKTGGERLALMYKRGEISEEKYLAIIYRVNPEGLKEAIFNEYKRLYGEDIATAALEAIIKKIEEYEYRKLVDG